MLAPNVLEKWIGSDDDLIPIVGYDATIMRRVLGAAGVVVGVILAVANRSTDSIGHPLWLSIFIIASGFGMVGHLVGGRLIPEIIRLRKSGAK
jgi:hypothetical protein